MAFLLTTDPGSEEQEEAQGLANVIIGSQTLC